MNSRDVLPSSPYSFDVYRGRSVCMSWDMPHPLSGVDVLVHGSRQFSTGALPTVIAATWWALIDVKHKLNELLIRRVHVPFYALSFGFVFGPTLLPPPYTVSLRSVQQLKYPILRIWNTYDSPSGNPASLAISARSMAAPGSFSDGFRTNVFPTDTARGNIHSGIIAGKLNGHIPGESGSSR